MKTTIGVINLILVGLLFFMVSKAERSGDNREAKESEGKIDIFGILFPIISHLSFYQEKYNIYAELVFFYLVSTRA